MNASQLQVVTFLNLTLTKNATNQTIRTTGHGPVEAQFTTQWTAGSVISVITLAFGLLGNSVLLFLFVKDQTLRTPFNVYLMNLLLANMLAMLLVYPLNIIDTLYSAWFLGDRVCTFYLYGTFAIQAGVFNAHQLIAVNRLWTVCQESFEIGLKNSNILKDTLVPIQKVGQFNQIYFWHKLIGRFVNTRAV